MADDGEDALRARIVELETGMRASIAELGRAYSRVDQLEKQVLKLQGMILELQCDEG
jgi:hypothetical protein